VCACVRVCVCVIYNIVTIPSFSVSRLLYAINLARYNVILTYCFVMH